jgi:hypothetical protein
MLLKIYFLFIFLPTLGRNISTEIYIKSNGTDSLVPLFYGRYSIPQDSLCGIIINLLANYVDKKTKVTDSLLKGDN